MSHRFARLRRFRFNLPQRIAALMLLAFLGQGLWLTSRQTLTERDYEYARCGRETWERPSPVAGYFTSCGNIHDGILAYRLAGLPLTVNLLAEQGLDHFRKPEDRVVQSGDSSHLSVWELRHQLTHVLLLLRLPFLAAGCMLGAGLWWVTRRLYGNLGGYTALAFYCVSPAILNACVSPSPEILAALGVYGGVYTCIGVAHAMQGPRRKPGSPATGLRRWGAMWRPRIVLLTVCFGLAAASHIVALPAAALLGLALMLWVAEGRRSQVLPIVLLASVGALVFVFICYNFSPDAFSYLFRSSSGFVGLSFDPVRRFFFTFSNAGIVLGAIFSLMLYLGVRRSRYFGNTAPLLCAAALFLLVMTGAPGTPWLWAVPFLLTLIAGVLADAYESPHRRIALAAAGTLIGLQVLLAVGNLAGVL